MDTSNILYIDSVAMPRPTQYEVIYSDFDNQSTTRTEAGILVRNRVRQGVVKLKVAFVLSSTEAQPVLQSIEPEKVLVRFYNPESCNMRSIRAYVSDRSCNVRRFTDDRYKQDIEWDVSFSLVEY